MSQPDFKILWRDSQGRTAHPRPFTGTARNSESGAWVTATPSHDFQKLSHKTITFPTYLDPDAVQGPLLMSQGAIFTPPSLPSRCREFSHHQIPSCDLCENCEEVEIRNLLGRGNGRKYHLGWADRILSCKSCALCRLITASLEYETQKGYPVEFEEFETEPLSNGQNLLERPSRCFVILTSVPSSFPLGGGKESKYHIYCYFLHWRTSTLLGHSKIRLLGEDAPQMQQSSLFYGRLTDPGIANLKLARSWLFECDHRHDCLFRETKSNAIKNLLVIDVRRNCLVELPTGSIYLALSYVWPRFDGLQLTKANIDQCKEPGFLDQVGEKLPKVIKDAFEVVRGLDESYIWIDALCIVQDDLPVKAKLIASMDKVYGDAYLTIAVGTSVAPTEDYAISGIGVSRKNQQVIETMEGLRFVTAHPDYNHSLQKSRWSTRGWTFQEGLLSKRCLIFTDDQMYFRCTRDARCEDVVTEPGTEQYPIHPVKPKERESKIDYLLNSEFLQSSEDWFHEYVKVVCDLTKRSLSYESDILNSFTGIMNKFSPHIEGTSFMSGHPMARFEKSLLWYPTSPSRRREADVAPGHHYPFPSWSWAGWVGSVDYEVSRPGSKPSLEEDLPTVQWFRWSEYGLVPVRDLWHRYRPPFSDSPDAFELSLLWRHAQTLRKNPSCIISWGTIVKRSLRLPETFVSEWVTDWEQSLPCFIIEDEEGKACGFIPSADRTWTDAYKKAGGGECELLTLSITQRSGDDLRGGERLLHEKYRTTGNEPLFYLTAMLIETADNGVSYRRGIGLLQQKSVTFNNLLSVDRKLVILG